MFKNLSKELRILLVISCYVFCISSIVSFIVDLDQDLWEYYTSREIGGQIVYVSGQDGSFRSFGSLIRGWDRPIISETYLPNSDRWGAISVQDYTIIAVHKKGAFSEKKHIWQFKTRS